MKELTLGEIAEILGGKLIGDPSVKVKGIKGIQEAEEGDLTFVASEKYLKFLFSTRASAAIVFKEVESPIPLIILPNPYLGIVKLMERFYPRELPSPSISPYCWISPSAKIGRDVYIGPFVYVGDDAEIGDRVILYPGVYVGPRVKIGEESILYPNVVLYEGTIIGKRVVIHAGTVIGSDGFGYIKEGETIVKIPQIGGVKIEDEVEIGANCAIDRATFGWTRIGRGTKMDNLVQVGHNVSIGENCLIVAQVGIGGSTAIGKGVILGGQVGISDHVKIGDEVQVSGKAGIFRDVEPGEKVGGIPQMPHGRWMKVAAELMRLPELRKSLKELKERLNLIEKKLKGENQ
jgi:UDP-3-O-[3-hydroxymyristoyl] glucosamine N-acyltransferase